MPVKSVADGGSGKAPAIRRGRSFRTTSSELGSETGSAPPSPLREAQSAGAEEGDIDSDAMSVESGTAPLISGRPSRRRSLVGFAAQPLSESDQLAPPAASKGKPLRTTGA